MRSHSIASKPQIVRRAVVNDRKPAHPRYRSLDPEVVALDPLLQVLGDVVGGRTWQQTLLAALSDRRRVGACSVRADPVRGEQRLGREHLAEEALGGIEVAGRGEQEVDCVPPAVYETPI